MSEVTQTTEESRKHTD